MASTKSHQSEVNVPTDRMWNAFKDSQLLCKVVPDGIKSATRTEDGFVTLYLTPAAAAQFGECIKQKVEYNDKEKKLVSEVLEGGGIGSKYKSKKVVTCFKPGQSAGSTLVAWDVICDPVGEDETEEAQSYSTLKKIEEHLQAHPAVYA